MIYNDTYDNFFLDPTGPKQMHWANGLRIVALQLQRGMSQKRLAKLSGVCVRTLRHMELYERAVKLGEIASVARVLGVCVDEIKGESAESLQSEHDWENLPIPVRDPRTVRRALAFDMNSNFDGALDVLQGGLAHLDPRNPADLRDWAFLCVKRDSIRSNAGRNREALDGLDKLLDAYGESLIPKPILRGFILYHRGVILRRMERLDEAAILFTDLLPRKIFVPGVWHQLGVLGQMNAGSDVNSPFLAAAEVNFTRSLEEWAKGNGSYRAGFSERRLGELYLTRGDRLTAGLYFYSACERFESDGCTRYALATKEAISGMG
jgi:tetratricopeptide (TPR) repeat protein